jgi:hypothetical protein
MIFLFNMNKDLQINEDGSITLCCGRKRCPKFFNKGNNTFEIIDDNGDKATFSKQNLINSIKTARAELSQDDQMFYLENKSGDSVLLESIHLNLIEDLIK